MTPEWRNGAITLKWRCPKTNNATKRHANAAYLARASKRTSRLVFIQLGHLIRPGSLTDLANCHFDARTLSDLDLAVRFLFGLVTLSDLGA